MSEKCEIHGMFGKIEYNPDEPISIIIQPCAIVSDAHWKNEIMEYWLLPDNGMTKAIISMMPWVDTPPKPIQEKHNVSLGMSSYGNLLEYSTTQEEVQANSLSVAQTFAGEQSTWEEKNTIVKFIETPLVIDERQVKNKFN